MISAPVFLPPRECDRPYTISEINSGLAAIIESGNTLVWVEGEISGFRRASSGHCYFNMKDAESRIPAVIWRSYAVKLKFAPEDGMAVVAIAAIRVYAKGGYYQLDIQRMQPGGVGAMFAALEKLKEKLAREGLFDKEHKKELPVGVETLGVITARGGAAIRDIIKVVSKRSPQTSILLYDVPVQGDSAPELIAGAIEDMNSYGVADCLIVGRGGGSVEDLWAFNDERVARAIFQSEIPVISAVGHETDFTIADFVADVRAPTPSAAAEMAVADNKDNLRYFGTIVQRFSACATRTLAGKWTSYRRIIAMRNIHRPLRFLSDARQKCDELREREARAMTHILDEGRMSLRHVSARLHALSPLAVLSRGYCVAQKSGGETVRNTSQIERGETITLRFSGGRAEAEVKSKADSL